MGFVASPGYQYKDTVGPLLYASQALTQQLKTKVIHTLRELSGGGMLVLPRSIIDYEIRRSPSGSGAPGDPPR